MVDGMFPTPDTTRLTYIKYQRAAYGMSELTICQTPRHKVRSRRQAETAVLIGMLLGSRFFDPIAQPIVVQVQSGFIIPSQRRFLRIFR